MKSKSPEPVGGSGPNDINYYVYKNYKESVVERTEIELLTSLPSTEYAKYKSHTFNIL